MTILTKGLYWFASAWMVFVALLGVLATVGTVLNADTLWQGLTKLPGFLNPFNIANFITMAEVSSPGLGAYFLADYLDRKRPSQRRRVF